MDANLKRLLSTMEKRLQCDDIKGFKIGKADSAEDRFNDSEYEHYHFMDILAKGCAQKIDQAERDLIDYFKTQSSIKQKCQNQIGGGGGNPRAKELYIVCQKENPDQFDGLTPVSLFNFTCIVL